MSRPTTEKVLGLVDSWQSSTFLHHAICKMSVTDLTYFSEDEQREIQAELDAGFKDIEEKSVISLSTYGSFFKQQGLIHHSCRYAVTAQKGFETMLVVDNIPVVDVSKKQRLIERLRQTFAKVGAPVEEESIDMPWNVTTGTNKGYVTFIPIFLSLLTLSFNQLCLSNVSRRQGS